MLKKTYSIFITFLTLATTKLVFANQAMAQTKAWEEKTCQIGGVATIQGVACLIANVLSVTLSLIGLAGFIMLIIGSIRWLISGGNAQNIESARKTITFAIIGLVVALSSFMIMNLIARFTGINVITEFFIPSSDTGLPEAIQWKDIGAPTSTP